jgi:hypothetical protein
MLERELWSKRGIIMGILHRVLVKASLKIYTIPCSRACATANGSAKAAIAPPSILPTTNSHLPNPARRLPRPSQHERTRPFLPKITPVVSGTPIPRPRASTSQLPSS